MNILFLTPYLPYPLNNGGLIRVHHLLVNLAARHDVTLLCLTPDNAAQSAGVAVLESQGINVNTVDAAANQKKEYKRFYQLLSLFSNKPYQYFQYYSKAMQSAMDGLLRAHNFEFVMVEFSQMGYYELPRSIPRFVDQHNVEYEIMQRTFETEQSPLRKLLAKSEWRKYRDQEISNCEKFDACLTTSARDAEILTERSAGLTCHVIPNGVDSSYFSPQPGTENSSMILFTGTISYYPNTEGILWFHKHVWPLIRERDETITFCIAGKSPPSEIQSLADDERITVTGPVDDMRDYYREAAVVIVPLRVGGGTRLKILEGMAMGKPILSTSVGAEGIDHSNGIDILIRDEPADFADAVVELISTPEQQQLIGDAGRKLVEAKYDWKAVSGKLCDIIEAEVPGQQNQ